MSADGDPAAWLGLCGGALRAGKATRMRQVLLAELAVSGHVHYLDREGAWCVTGSRIGPLWELLPRHSPAVIPPEKYDLF